MPAINSSGRAVEPLIIAGKDLHTSVAQLHLSTDGDGHEKLYWPAINDGFPYYEQFWQEIVTPTTKRVEISPDPSHRTERRDGIADDLWLITYANYSLFLNLVAAFEHLSQPVTLSVGNFYTHLASACDLAEDFLLRVRMCVAECRGQPIEFATLPKEQFLQRLDAWYEKEYQKKYPHSHAKGKAMLVRVPPDNEIASDNDAWKAYERFSQPIREFRNKIVHDVQIATVRVGNINLMPRVEHQNIQKYSSFGAVQKAIADPATLKRDFIVREEQIFFQFREFKKILNALWEQPTDELRQLLYEDRNEVLLRKYNLLLT